MLVAAPNAGVVEDPKAGLLLLAPLPNIEFVAGWPNGEVAEGVAALFDPNADTWDDVDAAPPKMKGWLLPAEGCDWAPAPNTKGVEA